MLVSDIEDKIVKLNREIMYLVNKARNYRPPKTTKSKSNTTKTSKGYNKTTPVEPENVTTDGTSNEDIDEPPPDFSDEIPPPPPTDSGTENEKPSLSQLNPLYNSDMSFILFFLLSLVSTCTFSSFPSPSSLPFPSLSLFRRCKRGGFIGGT